MTPSPSKVAEWLGALYDEMGPALYRYALMIVGRHAEAEDVLHRVFLRLLDAGRQDIDDVQRYLRRAVRNESYSTLRRRGRFDEPAARDDRPLLDAVAAAGTDPHERLALEAALRGLPAEQRRRTKVLWALAGTAAAAAIVLWTLGGAVRATLVREIAPPPDPATQDLADTLGATPFARYEAVRLLRLSAASAPTPDAFANAEIEP